MNKQTQTLFDTEFTDDFDVLNFLLEHVKGISPSSLTPPLTLHDSEIE